MYKQINDPINFLVADVITNIIKKKIPHSLNKSNRIVMGTNVQYIPVHMKNNFAYFYPRI